MRAHKPFKLVHPPAQLSDNGEVFQRLDLTAAYPYERGEYVRRLMWEWVERVFVRAAPRRAYGWRRFWLRRFGAQLADNCALRPGVKVVHPWLLTMGEFSIVAEGVSLYNLGRITIGAHTVISQDAYLCAGTHDYTKPQMPLVRAEIAIGSGVWVCAGAFIGPGVRVGDNSIVGARAVVMKDVPAGVVVAGNPARVVKERGAGRV